MSNADIAKLREIKTLPSLVKYLRDELDWPVDAEEIDDITFDYDAEELGLDDKHAVKVKEIKQLRPLDSKQPWGIFWVNFEKKKLPMVVLRRILGKLVFKKRPGARKAERPSWNLNDLLFISSYGDVEHREISFAHFTEGPESGDLPVLRVLGWDDQNTIMHLDRVVSRLHSNLRWPIDPADAEVWRETWSAAFTDRYQQAIHTSDELIHQLARLAAGIRQRVRNVLEAETERGPMRKLFTAVRSLLIYDMNEDAFADMYAQTVSYGLLSSSFSRPAGLTAQNLIQLTAVSNPFLENLLESLFRLNRGKSQFDVDEVGINDVLVLLRNTNFDAIKVAFNDENPAEDPVIRFYEGFLKEYDPKQRIERGVFFTPRPVVAYIVRGVHEMLQNEFGLEDGLASVSTWSDVLKFKSAQDPKVEFVPPKGVKPSDVFVEILDPATGTGTFLFECIELIEKTMKNKWCQEKKKKSWNDPDIAGLWNNYVSKHLLPRLFGFELKMAPYAIAHLKLALKLGETGYRFKPNDRLHIYLTNSLEAASKIADEKLASLFSTLANEAQAVNRIKRDKRFTVVIGNPPYAVNSANKKSAIDDKLDDYKVNLKDERNLKPINDDYVKFIRYSQLAINESGCGIIGMITNHSYATARLFRSMRRSLLSNFKLVYFVDLHGEANRDPAMTSDKNVFEIQQGVGISLYACLGRVPVKQPIISTVELIGPREYKYQWLRTNDLASTKWNRVNPSPEMWSFAHFSQNRDAEYKRYDPLPQIFEQCNIGYQTHRDGFVIDCDKKKLLERIESFRGSKAQENILSSTFDIKSNRDWNLLDAHSKIRREKDINKSVVTTLYRPFDFRHIIYLPYLIDYDRLDLMTHMFIPNRGLLVSKVFDEHEFTSVFVTKHIVESKVADRTRGSYLFPLFQADSENEQLIPKPKAKNGYAINYQTRFLDKLSSTLGLKNKITLDDKGGPFPNLIDIFNYIYAVLYSPTYRSRYADFLKTDFPRIPFTANVNMFQDMAKLGGQLVAFHLLESPSGSEFISEFVGNRNPVVEQVSYINKSVWIDKAKSCGFKGIPELVWNFHVGGYQVCERWLKERKDRQLSQADINHYQKIVVALNETIKLMAKIDKVIDEHGGWPIK